MAISTAPSTDPGRPSRGSAWLVLGVVTLLLLAALGMWWAGNHEPSPIPELPIPELEVVAPIATKKTARDPVREESRPASPASSPAVAQTGPRLAQRKVQEAPLPRIVRVRVFAPDGTLFERSSARLYADDGELRGTPGIRLHLPKSTGTVVKTGSATTGVHTFADVPPGRWRVWAVKSGYVAGASPWLEISDDLDGHEVDVTLSAIPRSHRLEGRVLESDGTPVNRTWVRFRPPGFEGTRGKHRDITDVDGRFVIDFEDPPPVGGLGISYKQDRSSSSREQDQWVHVVCEVEAGGDPIEVRLPPQRKVAVLTRDTLGNVHGPLMGLPLYLEFCGAWLQDPHRPHQRLEDGSIAMWVPSVPFKIMVYAQGAHDQEFGPFDPSEIGDVLVLEVEAEVRLAGRVTRDGRPVAGARLSALQYDRRYRGRALKPARVTTDGKGQFAVPLSETAEVELHAAHDEHGYGILPAQVFDAETGATDLHIELAPPARLEGTLRLPEGHSANEGSLMLNGPHGQMYYTKVTEQGAWRVDNPTPGTWWLQFVAEPCNGQYGELRPPGSHYTTDSPTWLVDKSRRRVEISVGEHLQFDWDLSSAATCRLLGVAKLDGQPATTPAGPGSWGGSWTSPDTFLLLSGGGVMLSEAVIDERGEFELATDRAGTYSLEIRRQGWTLTDSVELSAGIVSWHLDLPTGTIELEFPEGIDRTLRRELFYRWSAGERAFESRSWRSLDRRTLTLPTVPAGTGELCRRSDENVAVVQRIDVQAGATTRIRWQP